MIQDHPVSAVKWVDIDKIMANDYNPNSVPPREMQLLYHSIKMDGFTQPIVTYYDRERDKYIIVDGFHRYTIVKLYKDIAESTEGKVPVVVINKPLVHRMASTVRHNRARGRHAVAGLSTLVYKMLKEGMTEAEICNELGLTREEVIRLKHITGFSKLFKDVPYSRAWESARQIELRRQYIQRQGHEPVPEAEEGVEAEESGNDPGEIL